MLTDLYEMHYLLQALLAGLFTWLATGLGAAGVFVHRHPGRRGMDTWLGFAAGIMLAASVWSLLIPAMEMSEAAGSSRPWLPAALGFCAGVGFIWLLNNVLPHAHLSDGDKVHGMSSQLSKSKLLFLTMTLHNLPEGLAVGVAFGAGAAGEPVAAAAALTMGIAIQNVPEGLAVSTSLLAETGDRLRSFHYGQLSGLIEVAGAVLGAVFAANMGTILPYSLAFAAGAMVFVVVEDIIPESQAHGNHQPATLGAMAGFLLMMVLDNALG